VALGSLLAAVALTTFKIVVGAATGSLGILAEAAHSGLDTVAALLTLPESVLRRLYLRPLGTAAVSAAIQWLDPYRLELAGVAK